MKTYNTIPFNVAPWTNFIGYLTTECDITVFFSKKFHDWRRKNLHESVLNFSFCFVFPKDLLNIKELSQYGSLVIIFGNLRKLLTIQ